ncbi:TIGR04086 family membrane protein [Halobacillus sp. A5]|uniref:TIGR04086 family membrane protein n=1 Tax=Halobacillus sp. A5 TaxID=2880263 RepID=UPI0020A665CC|nr:TIGR04086 family membrane protein [Halobacillus sp. A5]MCP3025563.1 TIGR04086 family membrane protein [Halobacillus sp. A5]
MKRFLQGVLGYGVGSIFILMILFSAILASLLRFTTLDTHTLNQISLIAGLSILAFGGLLAAYKGQQKGWLTGLLTGFIFIVIMMLFQIVFENRWVSLAQLSYFGGLLLAASLGGMIGINMPQRRT